MVGEEGEERAKMGDEGMNFNATGQIGMDLDSGGHGLMDLEQNVRSGAGRNEGESGPAAIANWVDGEGTSKGEENTSRPAIGLDNAEYTKMRGLICSILREYRAENVMSESSKIVYLDSGLDLRQGFFVLLENGLDSAPVWNSTKGKFLATITISDFINFLFYTSFANPQGMNEQYASQTIGNWLNYATEGQEWVWRHVEADTSLYDSCRVLADHSLHYLPVYSRESNMVVQMLTHVKVLGFLRENLTTEKLMKKAVENGSSEYKLLQSTLDRLGIGTFKDLAVLEFSTPVVDCLQTMARRRLTELPVIDSEGKFVDVFSRHDVFELSKRDREANSKMSVIEAIRKRPIVSLP
uniref:CBS domain-containing protein n=1 Tax=Rhodosorus marinus TaxID=101924 RepID=A0A7S2ZUW3_9RHOD|mmetsp:Transcript_32001/g.124429  ORF Transcript_32001/g.124429 Transcript_32001/m.124429 type:complete len:353 (+) Transcript_32001:63-1121(+)